MSKRKAKDYYRRSNPLTPSMTVIRSAITNGTCLVDGPDHRSAFAKRWRDIIEAHTADLGGADNVSEGERSLIRRASMLALQLEMIEKRIADRGGEASRDQLLDYQRAANSLRRILESIGLRRRPKAVPSPLEYARLIERERGAA